MVAQHARGLSPRRVRAQFGLSRERMARLLDVSAKTIERWEERDALPANSGARARLAKLQEIAELGLIVYTPEGFTEFLITPLGEFGGRTALQLIAQGAPDDVLAALAGDYEGLGF
jgi:transcriptional regulator with XRE-family HTH domain